MLKRCVLLVYYGDIIIHRECVFLLLFFYFNRFIIHYWFMLWVSRGVPFPFEIFMFGFLFNFPITFAFLLLSPLLHALLRSSVDHKNYCSPCKKILVKILGVGEEVVNLYFEVMWIVVVFGWCNVVIRLWGKQLLITELPKQVNSIIFFGSISFLCWGGVPAQPHHQMKNSEVIWYMQQRYIQRQQLSHKRDEVYTPSLLLLWNQNHWRIILLPITIVVVVV